VRVSLHAAGVYVIQSIRRRRQMRMTHCEHDPGEMCTSICIKSVYGLAPDYWRFRLRTAWGMSRHSGSMIARVRLRVVSGIRRMSAIGTSLRNSR